MSIAASAHGLAEQFLLNDFNKPLMALWSEILNNPNSLCDEYQRQWLEQQADRKAYFFKVRDEFNKTHDPHKLLYLLARIVKGSVRYSSDGRFNQSADNRRAGMRPSTMRSNINCVSALLKTKTSVGAVDFREVIERAQENDLVYMDPPYQGTSFTRDHRYFRGLSYDDFVEALVKMNDRRISYIISYDGKTGEKTYGKQLPRSLQLRHLYIKAGRSSQATLLGSNQETIESLYLSPSLVKRIESDVDSKRSICVLQQQEISFA